MGFPTSITRRPHTYTLGHNSNMGGIDPAHRAKLTEVFRFSEGLSDY